MKNTPCLSCRNLRKDGVQFRCSKNGFSIIDDDIVYRGADLNIPDCPFFTKRVRSIEMTGFDPETEKLVVVPPREKGVPKKKRYLNSRQRTRIFTEFIKRFEWRYSRCPTSSEIYRGTALYSAHSTTYLFLQDMVERGELVKKPVNENDINPRYRYEIARGAN